MRLLHGNILWCELGLYLSAPPKHSVLSFPFPVQTMAFPLPLPVHSSVWGLTDMSLFPEVLSQRATSYLKSEAPTGFIFSFYRVWVKYRRCWGFGGSLQASQTVCSAFFTHTVLLWLQLWAPPRHLMPSLCSPVCNSDRYWTVWSEYLPWQTCKHSTRSTHFTVTPPGGEWGRGLCYLLGWRCKSAPSTRFTFSDSNQERVVLIPFFRIYRAVFSGCSARPTSSLLHLSGVPPL